MDSMRIDIRARAAFVPSRRASGVRRILRHFHEYQQHDTEWNLIQRMPDGSSVLSHNRCSPPTTSGWLGSRRARRSRSCPIPMDGVAYFVQSTHMRWAARFARGGHFDGATPAKAADVDKDGTTSRRHAQAIRSPDGGRDTHGRKRTR